MMMTNFKKFILSFFLFFFAFFLSFKVNAASANLGFSGASSVYVNEKLEVTLVVNNLSDVDGGISAVGSILNYDDSALEFVSYESLAPFPFQYINKSRKIGGLGMGNNITSNSSLIKLVFTAKKIGSTTISLSSSELSDSKGNLISCNNPSKSISINPPPSTNANLANISLSVGSISFNSGTTSYDVNVAGDVSSINIGANCEDNDAKVSGTGNKSLNYGKNVFNLVVTAPSGDKKTYTVTVNREDNRSSENNLKQLSVTDYDLNPKFSAGTLTYSLSVPFEVSSINVSAVASDDKASVKISGQNKLAAGRTTNVLVVVTAENGDKKTYTIKVRRANDPNKVLSNDHYLSDLSVSEGTLSPEFQKDVTDYKVTVSYLVEKIEITANPSDSSFGEVEIVGPDVLSAGDNKYEIIVTAEDSSKMTYVVVVTKEKNPNEPDEEESVPEEKIESLDLKSLIVQNGKLKEKFKKNKYLYHYKSKADIEIEAIAEDSENVVSILRQDDVYTIMVLNEIGERHIYTLVPENSSFLIVIIVSFIFIIVGFGLGYLIGIKKIDLAKIKKIFSKGRK